jgi:type II secretory pathway predicted ATPase ExeA
VEHLHHFGLRQDPFQNEPDLRFYFDSVSHTEPYRRVERGLRQNKGLCVMTGEGGTGKSLLARRLLETLEEEIFDAQFILIMPGATNAASVLNRYARMVGIEDASANRPALLAQIYEQLAIVREEGRHSVLIVDDAHLLAKEALAEIGGLLNLEYEDRRLVSLFLVGLPQLDVTLCHEASLGQRVDIRVLLGPLDYQNTSDYVMHRLGLAGGMAEIIPAEAMSALYKFGRGRPRLLNTLADNALFESYLAGRKTLTSEDIERAAADLGIGTQQGSTFTALPTLPAPSAEEPPVLGPAAVIPALIEANESSAMELNEMADPALEGASFELGGESASALELGELVDVIAPPDDEPLGMGVLSAEEGFAMEGTDELDSAVQEMLGESGDGQELPVFEGHNSGAPGGAEATRIALPDDLLEAPVMQPEPAIAGQIESDDELDDLFVELIDE